MSRTSVVVALFLVMTFMFYMMLLGAKVLRAQETTAEETTTQDTTAEETTAQETTAEETTTQGDCEDDEELVGSISGRDDVDETEPFDITGLDFRVVVNASSTAPTDGNVDVDILDEDGLFVDGAFVSVDPEFFTGETESSGVVDGPGTFTLGIDANGASYDIAICQTPEQGENTNDDEDTNDDGVIDNTIPKKPLPDTGGSTALMLGGSALLLLYGGLVAWRLKTRER